MKSWAIPLWAVICLLGCRPGNLSGPPTKPADATPLPPPGDRSVPPPTTDTTLPAKPDLRPTPPTRLTVAAGKQSNQNPVFSPDGKSIMFTRFLGGYNKRPSELVQIDLATLAQRVVIPSLNSNNVNAPGRSWEQGKICWSSDRAGKADEVFIANEDGTSIQQVTTHPESEGYYDEPVFFPGNTQRILFEYAPSDAQPHAIAIVELDAGGRVTILTGDPGYDDRLPAVAAGGAQVLFQRAPMGTSSWQIYTATIVFGSSKPTLSGVKKIPQPVAHNTDNSWCAHDAFVVSSSDHQGPMPNVWAVAPSTGGLVRIKSSSTEEHGAPSCSADAEWIAYEAHVGQDENTPADIWMVRAPPGLR